MSNVQIADPTWIEHQWQAENRLAKIERCESGPDGNLERLKQLAKERPAIVSGDEGMQID
jgi:hypothetical protein